MVEKHAQEAEVEKNKKLIDIRGLIASKNPRLAKWIPGFIIRYLKRILHEDTINWHLNEYKDAMGLDFVHATLHHFGGKLMVCGLENLDTNDRLLIASNHPLGGLDGLSLMASVGLKKTNLVFPVNDLLLNLPNLKDWFIPVNKHGTNPKEAVKMLDDVMASEKTILFFPAGLVSRKKKGKISDLEWKKTFVQKAKKHNRKIVPVYIDGQNSKFFYNLANLRKFFRIKTNIEMLYLVDEMYKQYNKDITVYVGKPLDVKDLPAGMNDGQLAEHIKSIVYELPHSGEFDLKNKHIVEYKFVKSEYANTP